jgi:hypothetical protein
MISYEIGFRNGQPTHELQWSTTTIPLATYTAIHDIVYNTHYYGPIRLETLKEIQHVAPGLSDGQIYSIYNATIREKVMHNYHKIEKVIGKIDYAHEDICDIAAKYNVPPLGLLRVLWAGRGISKQAIHDFLKTASTSDAPAGAPSHVFTPRDVVQAGRAATCDNENYAHITVISAEADGAEHGLLNLIRSLNIPCKSQGDLTAEQVAEHGRATITPDVLFTEPTYINNTRVHWIDYKNYVGTQIHLNKTIAQVAKYTKKWGPGAIVYGASHVEGLKLPCKILSFVTAPK